MKTICRIAVLVGIVLGAVPALSGNTATVHLRVTNVLGDDIRETTVAEFRPLAGPANNLSKRFAHNVATNIPFGVYLMKIYATGFRSDYRTVEVFSGEIWVIVELELGSLEAMSRYDLRGTVHLSGPAPATSVRMVGIRSSAIHDSSLDGSGAFSLVGLRQGTYVLIVTRGDEVLYCRRVEVPKQRTISLP